MIPPVSRPVVFYCDIATDLARRVILGVIFMPKHEYGLKICVAGDTDGNGSGNRE